MATNPFGGLIVSGSSDNLIQLWDPRTGEKSMTLGGHSHNIRALSMSNDGMRIISGSSDNTIKIWSVAQRKCIQTIEVHSEG